MKKDPGKQEKEGKSHKDKKHQINNDHKESHQGHKESHQGQINPCYDSEPIDQLIRRNGTRLRFYLVYHNEESEFVVRNYSSCRQWIVPIRSEFNKYCEYNTYRIYFSNLTMSDFAEIDYILLSGYKSVAPLNLYQNTFDVNFYDIHAIETLMKFAVKHRSDYDLIPLP
jgi:hypothetical protein